MSLGTGLIAEQDWRFVIFDACRALVWGTMAGFLRQRRPALVERLFRHRHRYQLFELADGSHPLQQELIRRAPGTYTHSMTVATLAEPAAEAIGANPLLTRVGSYFHDVGKMLKPDYFIENQSGENRHDGLEPALSTLVIIGHVKDGMALAEQYRAAAAGHRLHPAASRHHTGGIFLPRGAAAARKSGQLRTSNLEPTFRYPGPRPQQPRKRHRHARRCCREQQPGTERCQRPAACASWSTICS